MIKDDDAVSYLIPEAIRLINNEEDKKAIAGNCKKLGIRNSAEKIVDEVYRILKARKGES